MPSNNNETLIEFHNSCDLVPVKFSATVQNPMHTSLVESNSKRSICQRFEIPASFPSSKAPTRLQVTTIPEAFDTYAFYREFPHADRNRHHMTISRLIFRGANATKQLKRARGNGRRSVSTPNT